MKNTVVIGLCGSSGSGKGYVSSVFSSFGALHIDTDAVYHSLLEPSVDKMYACVKAIRREFGDSVLDGARLDRAALGDIVFSDGEKRAALNRINIGPALPGMASGELWLPRAARKRFR